MINESELASSLESKLWSTIRNDQLGVTFRPQRAVGNYIPDFYSPKAKLIIELDRSQSFEQPEYDQERPKCLESPGYTVIRFWKDAVMNNMDGVILAIIHAMDEWITSLDVVTSPEVAKPSLYES